MKNIPFKIVCLIAALLLPLTAQAQNNILIFGDSLSAGYGVARDSAWASLLQQKLRQQHLPYQVVNASISGETTAGGLRRLGKALQEHKPKIVVLELGANDGLRGGTIAETRKNLIALIKQSQQAHAQVLLLGMQIPPNYGLDYSKQFRELYPDLAKRYRVALVPFMLEGIPPEQFQADNLHPNEQAQPQILHNVEKELWTMLMN